MVEEKYSSTSGISGERGGGVTGREIQKEIEVGRGENPSELKQKESYRPNEVTKGRSSEEKKENDERRMNGSK